MSARIYVDLAQVHPVIDGVWHRARLTRMPGPGETVRTRCGLSAPAEYHRLDQRRAHGSPTACPDCDEIERRDQGIPAQFSRSR